MRLAPEPAAGAGAPAGPRDPSITVEGNEVVGRVQAMATDVTIRAVPEPGLATTPEAVRAGLRVFDVVERACTRFDPASDLMRANALCHRWARVQRVCFDALVEAHRAYERTAGRFDPRVFSDLVALGYDRSLPFATGD